MKISLTLTDFPMKYFSDFKEQLGKYVQASVQVGGEDTVFVTFSTNNAIARHYALTICDRYQFEVGK